MGCNMCVVHKPEEQYRVMFQVNGKELSRLSGDPTLDMRDPVLSNFLRRGTRRRTTLGGGLGAPGVSGAVTMGVADCVDSCTQTDISFQHMLTLGKSSQHPCGAPPSPDTPPSPPLPPLLDPCLLNELLIEPEYYDPNDYFDITQHEVDRQDELEYEEVELYKSCQQDKLGLTVCYRTDDEEDLGIYVGEVNPNSIAAVDGRIREGDRILQINGIDIQNREEAVAILTREDSTNIFLLLARPEIENDNQLDPDELELEPLDNALHLTSHHRLAINSSSSPLLGPAAAAGVRGSRDSPGLLQTLLSNSQELDSGVGRTDESTRYEESSEHDLLGDEHTSAPNTDATNTPGSMRKFTGHADTPPLLLPRDLQLSADSLPGLEPPSVTTTTATPGLTEEECERYRELLEIRCYYERNNNNGFLLQGGEPGGGATPLDVNRNEGLMQHELALVEEELRHLEFKYRNILRAQKMQQLRERCLKAWPPEEQQEEEEGQGPGAPEEPRHHVLSDINELPERWDKDSSSAYNTGGDSCRSTPLLGEQHPPSPSMHSLPGADVLPAPGSRHRERGGGGRVGLPQPCSPGPHVREAGAKFRARRASDGGARRSPSKAAGAGGRAGGRSAENSPCLARRQAPQRYRSCLHLGSPSEDGARGPEPPPPPPPRMEWKVKIRSDGSRYVAKRPVRDRLLKARAIKIREERSGMTTDDDAVSEMKMGRYWSKEERKQQLLRAREHRRRREFMMQSRLDCLRDRGEAGAGEGEGEAGAAQQGATTLPLEPPSILELCHRRSMKKRSRRILDNWITIQELLAHGTRSPDGKKIYNPLLSVTTV